MKPYLWQVQHLVIFAFRVATVAFGDEFGLSPTLFVSTKAPYSQLASAKLNSYKPISENT